MPGYNFKKAFYGKRNRKTFAGVKKAVYRHARKELAHGWNEFKKQAPRYIEHYGPMAAESIAGMGAYHVGKANKYLHGRGFSRTERGAMGYAKTKGKRYASRSSLENGEMTITHTEYLGDLISSPTSGAFSSQNYAINASATSFPWLCSTAINFQEYKFKKLVFEYRPLVSESTSTSTGALLTMGSVIAATQYNSISGPYLNKQTMIESDFAKTCKPSEHLLHAIECDPHFNPLGILYCSAQTSLTQGALGSDIRMQNLGIFQLATSGVPGNSIVCGEIFAHYTVCLYKPQMNAYLSGLQSSHYYGTAADGTIGGATPFGSTVSATTPPLQVSNNLLQLSFTPNTFTFPLNVTSGNFLCVYYLRGQAAVTVSYGNPVGVTGCTVLAVWNAGVDGSTDVGVQGTGPQTTLAGTIQLCMAFVVQVNAPGQVLATVQLPTTTIPTGGEYDFIVTPYNSLML